jgi:ribosomal protein S18 acetylase RimI-like enzyme
VSYQVTVRRARPSDEHFLRSVFADSNEEFSLLGPDVRDILLDMQYRGFRRDIQQLHPNAERFVITVDAMDVGVMTYDCSAGSVEILELAVARSRRRRGIGTAALSVVPSGPKLTTVRSHNRAARTMLTRNGFSVADEARGRVTLSCA